MSTTPAHERREKPDVLMNSRFEALIPASARKCISVLGGEIGEPDTFSLSRCKGGAEVWLHCGRLNVNLNLHLKHTPASFEDARQWVKEIGVQFGINLPERPRRRRRVQLRLVRP